MSKATDIISELDHWLAVQIINRNVSTLEERSELGRELQKYAGSLEQIWSVLPIVDAEEGVTVGTGGQPGKYTREMSEQLALKPEPIVIANNFVQQSEAAAEMQPLIDAYANQMIVHILDQAGQPYGSERRCCNRCGLMLWPEMQQRLGKPVPIYTESWDEWNAAPNNCSKAVVLK